MSGSLLRATNSQRNLMAHRLTELRMGCKYPYTVSRSISWNCKSLQNRQRLCEYHSEGMVQSTDWLQVLISEYCQVNARCHVHIYDFPSCKEVTCGSGCSPSGRFPVIDLVNFGWPFLLNISSRHMLSNKKLESPKTMGHIIITFSEICMKHENLYKINNTEASRTAKTDDLRKQPSYLAWRGQYVNSTRKKNMFILCTDLLLCTLSKRIITNQEMHMTFKNFKDNMRTGSLWQSR